LGPSGGMLKAGPFGQKGLSGSQRLPEPPLGFRRSCSDKVKRRELSEEAYRKSGLEGGPFPVSVQPKMLFWGGGSKPFASTIFHSTALPTSSFKAMSE